MIRFQSSLSAAVVGACLAIAALGAPGCGGDEGTPPAGALPPDPPAPPDPPEPPAPPDPPTKPMPYDTLSEYGFFEGALADLKPAAGVVPYTVAAPLWADHAGKGRFLVLPEGEKITVGEVEDWQFPLGTIVIKTFFLSLDRREPEGAARILETRLLILGEKGWKPHTYVWNEEQTGATRTVAGTRIELDTIDASGSPARAQYLVPNTNQCNSCHERDDRTEVLGLITPQLNRDIVVDGAPRSQLAWLEEQGLFREPLGAPEALPSFPDPAGDAPLDARARAYLHGNCSHCHRPGGGGGVSGLVLLGWEAEPSKNGVCKVAAAAGAGTGGNAYDIVPGAPDESIMVFRMGSTDPEIKMPELSNRLPDAEGIALVRAWIADMEPKGCGDAPAAPEQPASP
ncbi:SO2930 family diheme c-type cytochrome [Sorangium sp. So ce1099]|uniref:SO2930 family diheme c-type cytochrome n=1 Tax=Sorangium sp. So ce1099 TaxID=3133331 RepID=UPI003F62772B